ncbi:MAG: hypothetical protein AMS26_07385 [Bacteroides sp. SM23_62]|nr:MAG: hypothetical protein AMS26_07385 [Bacteroides sp. SM23_62]
MNRGFFNLSVWRGSRNHHPYNARVMEGNLSLVWFYTSQRPWNPYYDDPSLKARIEAALIFRCDIQNEDGRFSEYGTERWSLAPTAFATKFIGRALWLLNSDPEIEVLLQERFHQSMDEFQSPAGFFYEKGGPDWEYYLSTHHSDLQVAWHYAEGKEFHDEIIEKTKNWYDWFSYNAVKEPDNLCYYLNRAIETRQRKGFYLKNEAEDPASARWVPKAEFIPLVHAFEPSRQEMKRFQKQKYDAMGKSYPDVAPLQAGIFNAFSPYAFLHEGMEMWLPIEHRERSSNQPATLFEKRRLYSYQKR